MKSIGRLFKLDWKRIVKSPFAFLLICALVIIPSLYCWFNVWALWDPYSNTQQLKVAVYSEDKAATFNGKPVAIGDQLITQLKGNDKLGWQFVASRKDVVEGVKSGKYYAGIVVPKQFSSNLLSFVDGKIQKPQLDYYVNEKINAIAPKITATGASTLQSTISDEFTNTVATTIMGALNQAGVDLNTNLPLLRRFASLITNTNDQLPTIQTYLDQVATLQAQVPTIEAKLKVANEMATYLPAVNTLAQKLVGAQAFLPAVDEAGQLAVATQAKIPLIQSAGTQLQTVVTNFNQLETGVNRAVSVTNSSLLVIDQVDGTLPALTEFGRNAQAAVTTTKDTVLPKIATALGVVQNAVDSGLTLIQVGNTALSNDLALLQTKLQALDASGDTAAIKTEMAATLTTLATRQTTLATNARQLATTLTRLQTAGNQLGVDTSALTTAITRLNTLADAATAVANQANALAQEVPTLSTAALQTRLAALQTTADSFANAAAQLQALDLSTSIQLLITQFKTALSNAQTTLEQINTDIVPALPGLLADTKTLLTQARTFLTTVQTQLPTLKTELTAANNLLNGHMTLITSGLTTVAGLYQNDFPALKGKLSTAATFIQNDLPGIETDLTNTLALANAKLPELKSGLSAAQTFIDNDWPTLKTAIQKGATAIEKGEQEVDVEALIKLLRRDATKEADFLANPVKVKETALYPIPTYGSQSAPFYLALCIWVGALLLGALIMTEYHLPEEWATAPKPWQRFLARWLTFAGLGVLQALIAALGNIYLIGAYVVDKPLYVISAMGLSLVFVTILYTLIALFGNVGKGIGIIILVLSISGAGGNFPVVLSGQFFQAINPWLPFTYAVNLLRESTGGVYWPSFWGDAAALTVFGILFFALGMLLKGPIRPWVDKMHHITQKSKIIE